MHIENPASLTPPDIMSPMDNGVLSQLLAPALQKAAVEHGQADLASNAISALDDMEQQVSPNL